MSQENLPNSVLYAISARIGGIGLDLVAHETIRGIQPYLGKAISYGVKAADIDRRKMKTLRCHPVRLLSLLNLERKYYYAAKKRAVDRVAAQFLKTGHFDLFHVWSGSALHGLRVAKSLGIPSLLEIPTWHRQKGKVVPRKTDHEIAMENAPIPQALAESPADQPPRELGGVRIGRFGSGRIEEGSRLVSGTRISERKAVQHATRSRREPL
jgi:hypothetical protein